MGGTARLGEHLLSLKTFRAKGNDGVKDIIKLALAATGLIRALTELISEFKR